MKIITKTELEEMHLKMKKGRSLFLMNAIRDLKPGQTLFMSKEEWEETKLQSTPGQIVINATKHPRGILKGQRISVIAYEEGWVFEKYE